MDRPRRFMIHLTPQEVQALQALAAREKRPYQQQAAIFIRQGLGLDGQTVRLSSVAVSALTRMAKERGLNTLDEALERLIWDCAGAVGWDGESTEAAAA